MSSSDSKTGAIQWTDLTVKNAKKIRDFYRKVAGWTVTEVDMGGYDDYCMNAPGDGKAVAGVCHARGPNAKLPPQWLIYITVDNLDKRAKRCAKLGGKIIVGPKAMGDYGRYCVIKDPSGAVAALFEPAPA